MLVAIAGIRIFFGDGKPDCFLRAGMHTGKTGLTISWNVYSFLLYHPNGSRRTYLFANFTSNTTIGYTQEMLPRIRGHLWCF